MPTIEETIILAATAHRGQKDLAGLPYITHVMRVASSFVLPAEDDERTVSLLHDVVEDTEVTLKKLRDLGYYPAVVDAVDAISRRKGRFASGLATGTEWHESYSEYIERVALNPLATRVKLADLRDLLDERRVSTGMLSPETRRKYQEALMRLSGVSGIATGR